MKAGLTLGDVDQYPTLDVCIDGADEWVNLSQLRKPKLITVGWITS